MKLRKRDEFSKFVRSKDEFVSSFKKRDRKSNKFFRQILAESRKISHNKEFFRRLFLLQLAYNECSWRFWNSDFSSTTKDLCTWSNTFHRNFPSRFSAFPLFWEYCLSTIIFYLSVQPRPRISSCTRNLNFSLLGNQTIFWSIYIECTYRGNFKNMIEWKHILLWMESISFLKTCTYNKRGMLKSNFHLAKFKKKTCLFTLFSTYSNKKPPSSPWDPLLTKIIILT